MTPECPAAAEPTLRGSSRPRRPSYRLGIDIGGTFTDVVLLSEDGGIRTHKVLSTPDDYARGVVEGAMSLLREASVEPADVVGIIHATTVASNTVLEGRGARTGLITTEGFRDVLEMRRLRIPVMYDLQYSKPAPLVPRRHRFEVAERMGPHGKPWRPLDESSVTAAAEGLAAMNLDALAVSLLHSYANPDHEHRVADLIRSAVGDGVYITCSADILPEVREYERTSTAVVNAYIGPAVRQYLQSLVERLAAVGLDSPLEIMQSAGGTMTPAAALARPAHLVESGPAAGVIACAFLARVTELHNLISFDMGGTTAKAAILEDGEPIRTTEYEIGGGINLSSRLIKGGGYPIKLPFVDLSEIGAGGGSIVNVDGFNRVTVGPHSAGAAPGPICYGLGGVDPTLADALAVLGFLNPSQLAGGAVTPSIEAASGAIQTMVGDPLGISAQEAAYGVLKVAVSTMTRAVKAVSTYRGRDPREFTLCAFGGNGPVVGVEVARALNMSQVIVPPAPGVFSAIGLLVSQGEQEFVRTLLRSTEVLDSKSLSTAFDALMAEAAVALAAEGIRDVTYSRLADVRYAGQAYELSVRLPDGPADIDEVRDAFVAEHVRTYGHGSRLDRIDLVSIRVVASLRPRAQFDRIALADKRGMDASDSRTAYFGPTVGVVTVPVIAREDLSHGRVTGPLFIDEYDSTTVVPPDCFVKLDAFGSIEIDVR